MLNSSGRMALVGFLGWRQIYGGGCLRHVAEGRAVMSMGRE